MCLIDGIIGSRVVDIGGGRAGCLFGTDATTSFAGGGTSGGDFFGSPCCDYGFS